MNNERPIEKLLRRYAKKRRDESGAAPELHPATRRLLQGEVARQYPPARPVRPGGFLAVLQARWVYAAACLIVVGVGIVLVRFQQPDVAPLADNEKELSLAKAVSPEPEALARAAPAERKQDKLETASGATPAPAAPVVPAETAFTRAEATSQLSFDDAGAKRTSDGQSVARTLNEPTGDRYGLARADQSVTLRPQSHPPASIPPPALAESKTAPVGLAGTFVAEEAGKDVTVAASPTAAPQPARRPSSLPLNEARARNTTPARGGGLERDNRTALTQSFANVAGPSATDKAKQSPAANVLMNFRIEQAGDQLRVIDGDGSTYLGVTPGVAADAAASVAQKGVVSFSQENRPQTKSYFRQSGEAGEAARYLYRVEGTNRTLNQAVSFAWNFVAPTNPPGTPTQSAGATVQALAPMPWTEAVINGRVQINTGTQFELNATPVK
jgi:hypothetical protein